MAKLTLFLACVAAGVLPHEGFAANLASDSAAHSAYDDGWQTGDSGGSGWGSAWTLTTSGSTAAFSVANATSNGDGDTLPPFGDINTPQTASGRAWALGAGTSSTADAVRYFDGALSIGQTFLIDCDTGTLTSGFQAGFRLENSLGNALWELHFNASNFPNIITDGGGSITKFGSGTDEGFHIAFTLTSATNYSVTLTPLSTAFPSTYSSTLISAAGGTDIARFHLFFTGNTASTAATRQFFNNTAVIPEPSSAALLFLGSLFFAARRSARRT